MLRIFRVPFLLFLLISLTSCFPGKQGSLSSIYHSSPLRQLKNYRFVPESSIIERIKPLSSELLQALAALDNTKRYSSYMPNPSEMKLFEEYLEILPAASRRIMKERLAAIYFVDNFMGSGMTDYVLDERDEIYVILYLNPKVFQYDISSWLAIRESTCFIPDPDVKVVIDAGTKFKGLMYILLHESAHMLDYVEGRTPFVEKELKISALGTPQQNPYTAGVWSNFDVPMERYTIAPKGKITFYGSGNGPRLPAERAEGLYRKLSATPFVSLYGSMNWAEDYAEMATFYHLTRTLDQPYRITVQVKNEKTAVFSPMSSALVKERINRVRLP